MNYLPGLEPDFDVKQELRFIGGMPDLHQFDRVFISCSGGKDSHAMAYILAELATIQNYSKANMELIYADTGLEWHDTFDQVQRIGNALGIKSVKVLPKYTLLDNVRRRWAKFNGLPDNWQTALNKGVQTDRQTDRRRAGKTGALQIRSRTTCNGSATATTNEVRSSNLSGAEQLLEQTFSIATCTILHSVGKARAAIPVCQTTRRTIRYNKVFDVYRRAQRRKFQTCGLSRMEYS